MEAEAISSDFGSVYIDNAYDNNILSFKNDGYTLNNSTRIAVSGIKVEFCQENIVNQYLHFDLYCSALDNYMGQKLCSVHFVIDKNCSYKEVELNNITFKSIIHTQPVITFTANNTNIILRHIILLYNNYG